MFARSLIHSVALCVAAAAAVVVVVWSKRRKSFYWLFDHHHRSLSFSVDGRLGRLVFSDSVASPLRRTMKKKKKRKMINAFAWLQLTVLYKMIETSRDAVDESNLALAIVN